LIIYRIRILKCAIASPSGSFPEADGMIVSCGGQHNRRMRHLWFAKPSQTLTPNPPPHHQFIAIATSAIGVIHAHHQFTLGHTNTSNSEPRSSKQEASLPCFPAQAPRHEMKRSPDCLCPTASCFVDVSSRHGTMWPLHQRQQQHQGGLLRMPLEVGTLSKLLEVTP
jgi:hypothetical protein